jgi:hypothetical protein
LCDQLGRKWKIKIGNQHEIIIEPDRFISASQKL